MSTSALRTAASGMNAQQINIQVISNNIANISTTAFKKNRPEFQDLIYQEIRTNPQNVDVPGIVENPEATVQVGTGVKSSTTQKIFTQGDLQQTGQQLDVAIHGEGFFQLRKPDGTYVYTRDGSFKLSQDGTIVSTNGNVLEPGFTIDQDSLGVEITRDGHVNVIDFSGERIELGTLDIVRFLNPGGLRALGDNLYQETAESGEPIIGTPGDESFGELHQGYLEASNVDIVEEMVNMITAQRAYEINSKTVKTVDDMMQIANNLKR